MKTLQKIRLTRVLSVMLLLSIIFAFNACKKASEKTSEKIIEKSIGDDADVDIEKDKVTVKTDEGTFTTDVSAKEWPKTIPDDVPKFTYGDVTGVTTQEMDGENHWVIMYENISKSALEDYKTDLKNKDFTISFTTIMDTGGQLSATKNNLTLLVMAGEGNATVTIGTQK